MLSGFTKHFHLHHPICPLNPWNCWGHYNGVCSLWHSTKELQLPLCSSLLTLFPLVVHWEYQYKYFCAGHNQVRVLPKQPWVRLRWWKERIFVVYSVKGKSNLKEICLNLLLFFYMYSNNLQFLYCQNQLKVSRGKWHCTIYTSNEGHLF